MSGFRGLRREGSGTMLPPMRTILIASAALLLGGCAAHSEIRAPATPSTASAAPDSRATSGAPRFIEDDYAAALAAARAANEPLFIDSWAPWCHSCRSLRAYVLDSPKLGVVAPKFVWLSINTEEKANQAFLARFPVDVWPTLLVVDPRTQQPIRKWLGSATIPEMISRLNGAAEAYAHPEADANDRALEAADQLGDSGHLPEAIAAYRKVLASSPKDWVRRPHAVEGLIFDLLEAGDSKACVQLALKDWDAMPKGTSLANLAFAGLDCAVDLPKDSPLRSDEATLEQKVSELVKDDTITMLADDRSGLYQVLVAAHQSRGDAAGAKQVAAGWQHFLDQQAAAAKTPQARTVFDSHRMLADLAVGEPQKAVTMLEKSEQELPNDYNPPARLAYVYLRMHQPDKALDAANRAEKKVYGPRTINVLLTKSKALDALGRKTDALAVLSHADQVIAALPKSQRSPGLSRRVAHARAHLTAASK